MRYPHPLVPGRFIRRYKRFFADVRLEDGSIVTAHCANTGAMTGCTAPDAPVRLSPATSPARKLRWSLEQIYVGRHWILAHTARPNRVVEEAIVSGRVPSLRSYAVVEREKRAGDARLDLRLSSPGRSVAWVEVKNVSMLCDDDVLRFPDAVTTRGRRHLQVLADRARAGERAVLFLHVGHTGGMRVEPARDVDPAWAEALAEAIGAGVEVESWRVALTAEEAVLDAPVPFSLG